jgi:hypothetical protein
VPVTGASYSLHFLICIYRFTLPFFEDLGFFVFQLFFNLLCLRDAQSFGTGTDPSMSSEVQGGLPQVQASCQGSRAYEGLRQRKHRENQEEKKARRENCFITSSIPEGGDIKAWRGIPCRQLL